MASQDAAAGPVFSPVGRSRMSTYIVEQVREQIRSGALQVGARLPSERDLVEQFGVSRLVVREALRVLEASGLVVIKKGNQGGAFVSAPTSRQVEQGIADMLSASVLSSRDVTEARAVIEIGFVALAAERATPDDVRRLHEICDRDERARVIGDYSVEMSFEFHSALIDCAHNEAASLLLNGFHDPIVAVLQAAGHAGTSGVAEHRSLARAVEAGEPDEARALMAAHLQRTERAVD